MKIIRYIMGIGLLLPAFAYAPAFAESNNTSTATPTVTNVATPASEPATTTTTTTTKTEDTTGSSDSSNHGQKIGTPLTDEASMTKRLDALKTGMKVKLDDATKKRIELKCKPAQTTVGGTVKDDQTNGVKHDERYKQITDNVTKLIDKLKANNVDTTALAAAEAALEVKVATFNTDMTTLQQTLSDLKALDCATDPTAFQAALTAARTQRETVRNDALNIRTYITATLKPALEAVKAQLKPVDSTTTKPNEKATDMTKTPTTTSGGTN